MSEHTEAGSGTTCSLIGGVPLSPGILEQLDDQGVPDELLETRTLQEKQALGLRPAGVGCAEGCVLPPAVRRAALSFLCCVVEQSGLPQTSWMEASALLDMYHLKTQDPGCILRTITTLPATCAALMSILKKNDDMNVLVGGSSFVQYASAFAQKLHDLGYPTVKTAVTCGMVNDQERRVLEALSWRIQVSTTESWANTFITRFNVLTSNVLSLSLQWVWQQGIFGARLFMMQQALSPEQPPKMLAAGLLALGLAGARLLPLEAIQPEELSYEEWQQLYEEVQPQEPQPHCALPRGHWQSLLHLLTVAVGTDLSMVKQACHLACCCMRPE